MWGRQPYSTATTARDNVLLAVLTYGEGYHNFHHTFQWDYRNGIHWWHWDPTKWMIRLCSWIGLTGELKRCSPAQIEAVKLDQQFRRATERCQRLAIPDSLHKLLEQEYEQLHETLKLWSRYRQEWYEARSRQLHEALGHWDRLAIRDAYREIHFKLKIQRRRWQQLLQSLTRLREIPAQ